MRILLAVDGSKYSKWAIDFVLKLPLKTEPRINILHAVDLPTHRVPLVPDLAARKEYINKLRAGKLEEARELVGGFEKQLGERFKRVSSEVAESNAAEGIIEKSTKDGVDLVVIGSRGLSDISAFLLGGVSQRVVTYSPCSVMVVKQRVQGLKKILLAVDGSPYSAASVDFLKSAFWGEGLEIVLLHVWDVPFEKPERVDFMEEHAGELKEAGFGAVTAVVEGNPAKVIIDEAKRRKSNLIVLGSKGVVGMKMFLLGRTARKVITYGDTTTLLLRGV